MPVTIGTSEEQLAFTVNMLLQRPLMVPELMRNLFMGQFVADQILRREGRATGGAAQWWVSGPVFADVTGGDAEAVAPLAEIPVVNPQVGTPQSGPTIKRGLGLRISREMRDRDAIGVVLRGMTQIRNSIVRAVDGSMLAALNAAITQTVAAGAPWGNSTGTTIRKDLAAAELIFANLQTQGYDYQPDTMVAGYQTRANLRNSPEFLAPFIGNVADQNPQLTGTMAEQLWGKTWIWSPLITSSQVYMLQKNVVGGIADERGAPGQPIEVSDPYPEPQYEATRWDVTRAPIGFIDNPGAVVEITGT